MPKVDISYWNDESDWMSEQSQREYESHTIAAATVPDISYVYDDHPRATHITLHIDEETGVVVYDVAKYERSLR